MAQGVGEKLVAHLELTPELHLRQGSGMSAELYRHFTAVLGRYFWNQRTEQALKKAVSYFERAIAVDPQYALAHAGVADHCIMLGVWDFIPATEANARVEAATNRALEIDDAVAEGHSSLGFWNALFIWDWPVAERHFKRALELNPQHVQARYWYGIYLTLTSRFTDPSGK